MLGPVAQRIEQQPSKLKVAGSIPAGVAPFSDIRLPAFDKKLERLFCSASAVMLGVTSFRMTIDAVDYGNGPYEAPCCARGSGGVK